MTRRERIIRAQKDHRPALITVFAYDGKVLGHVRPSSIPAIQAELDLPTRGLAAWFQRVFS